MPLNFDDHASDESVYTLTAAWDKATNVVNYNGTYVWSIKEIIARKNQSELLNRTDCFFVSKAVSSLNQRSNLIISGRKSKYETRKLCLDDVAFPVLDGAAFA